MCQNLSRNTWKRRLQMLLPDRHLSGTQSKDLILIQDLVIIQLNVGGERVGTVQIYGMLNVELSRELIDAGFYLCYNIVFLDNYILVSKSMFHIIKS